MTPEEQAAADAAEAARLQAEADAATAQAAQQAEIDRLANERAQALYDERVAAERAKVVVDPGKVMDPWQQAAADLQAQGLEDYSPNYEQQLRARAMAIHEQRLDAKYMAMLGQAVIPIQHERTIDRMSGGDKYKQEFLTENVGMFNPNDPKQVRIMELAAQAYATEKTPNKVVIQGEKGDVAPSVVLPEVTAEANRLAQMAGVTLTPEEIADALRQEAVA